jgi:uncharacterized membrane protein
LDTRTVEVPAEFVADEDGERHTGTVRFEESYSGPIPPAVVARGWQELIPDAPERILRMAEIAQEHAVEIKRRQEDRADKTVEIASLGQKGEAVDRRIIIIGVLTLAAFTLLVGVWFIAVHNVAGYAFIVPALGVLITAAVRALKG